MKLKEYQKKLSIRVSNLNNAGLGCFANEDINVGECIGWYNGKKISSKEWKSLKDDSYIWMIKPDNGEKIYYIDAKNYKHNNKLRYVNSYKTPGQFVSINVEAFQYKNKIYYETIKKIKKGMELIVDYGEDFNLMSESENESICSEDSEDFWQIKEKEYEYDKNFLDSLKLQNVKNVESEAVIKKKLENLNPNL